MCDLIKICIVQIPNEKLSFHLIGMSWIWDVYWAE